MGIVLGIDIGGSFTKAAGLRADASVLSALHLPSAAPALSFRSALEAYLSQNQLSLHSIDRIALTGVGAASVPDALAPVPLARIDEFSAIGEGGLALSGRESAVVVSMGTGTAFISARRGEPVRHLAGSGIGGGTLRGLAQLILSTDRFERIDSLSASGRLEKVDLTISDMTSGSVGTLPGDTTAANLGKLCADASQNDLAAGLVNLVLQSIGSMALFACRSCETDTAVLTGGLASLSRSREMFRAFDRLYGVHFIVPEQAAFATAVGAAACCLHQ